MEAFEYIVKVFLEDQGYVVTGNVKFPVRRKTRKAAHEEYQTHGYEVDVVGARHDSLVLGSVKSFFGSRGVDRQGFKGIADPRKRTHFERYTLFNEPEVREAVVIEASKRYGYPASAITMCLFAGNFVEEDQTTVTQHLAGIIAGAGPVVVYDLQTIMEGVIRAAGPKTYINDPVVSTIKALKEVRAKLAVPGK